MISIQDKILKFQKLIYNKDLDDFIPIDQQFIGSGITMQSLIKQNAFIVEEIKKMKNVFVNYCKLNKTVYQKITQHELSLHAQTNKILSISTSIQSKLNDAIRQVKEMYQEMKHQTNKTRLLVSDAVKPLQEAISRKVDETSFAMHIKRIMAELDEDPQNFDGGNGGNQNSSLSPDDLQIRKRKGKPVGLDEYEAEKTKNAKLFLELSSKIQQLQTKNRETDPIIYKNSATVSKLTLTVDEHETQVFKLNQSIKQARAQINNTEQRLLNEINTRTSDNVWEIKLGSFECKSVMPRFQNLANEIIKNQRQFNINFANLEPRFSRINENFAKLSSEIQKNKNQIKGLNEDLSSIDKKISDEIQVIEQKLGVVYNEKKAKIEQIHEKIDGQIKVRMKQIDSLNGVIKELSRTIEQKVVMGVKKSINTKIMQIQKSIHSLTVQQKQKKQQILITRGEIHNIKQVLSKKANFTDILVHFERKADKQDFKQLKDRIQVTSPSHLRSTIIQNPQRTRRTISASNNNNSRKRMSMGSRVVGGGGRNSNNNNGMGNNNGVNNNDDRISLQSQNDMSSRMFMMGLESEMGMESDRRRMSYTESGLRRRKMKGNGGGGVMNMFGN